ncbi:MAG TPA: hypothetical protein DEA31_01975 [Alphaproteobacteria bacterium]|nr:hypothetical protein [Alphaproteobacteria bacterium]
MKKTITLATAMAALTAPAMAANIPGPYSTVHNMENPLYLPEQNMFYSKLSNGIMLKVADNSWAHREKNHSGGFEFPIVRVQEEMGYGITDRWAAHFLLQYTHDNDIGRTGLSGGRLGTTYRILNLYNGFVWDVYGDIHLGGLGEMRGTYNVKGDLNNPSSVYGVFDYDNYSDGMWGFHAGTKFGHVWDKFTAQAFVEILHTFADDNNMIRVVGNNSVKHAAGDVIKLPATTAAQLALAGAPNQISAKIKGYTDISAGVQGFYEFSTRWSMGGWFKFNRHSDHGVDKITTEMPNAQTQRLARALEKQLADMEDGWDEYVIGASVSNQLTDNTQITLYGEYTLDDSHRKSQNGTDVKAEMGVRLNFTF